MTTAPKRIGFLSFGAWHPAGGMTPSGGDALRQTMVGGTPFVPLGIDALVLTGWLVATLAISARFFRWQ